MAVNSEAENRVLSLWLLLNRVGPTLNLCQDLVYGKYGLTTEQFSVLAALRSRGPLRPIDLASVLERAPNSMSQLVDRMVKAGLVKRRRDSKNRRAVFVSMTDKGREAVEPAIPAGWEFIHKILSPLSDSDQRALAHALETVKCELIDYLNPEFNKTEIINNSVTKDRDLYKRFLKHVLPPGYQVRNKRRKK